MGEDAGAVSSDPAAYWRQGQYLIAPGGYQIREMKKCQLAADVPTSIYVQRKEARSVCTRTDLTPYNCGL